MNEGIRARDVRLISESGEQLGILTFRDALRIAQQVNLDLVEIAPAAKPPVCKIMDYGRFKYEQSKRDREARKKQKIVDLKELKMRPTIEEHDFSVKLRNGRRFLGEGDKIKAVITFRGREVVHSDLGRQVLERLCQELADVGLPERAPRLEGRFMSMIISPKPGVQPVKAPAVKVEAAKVEAVKAEAVKVEAVKAEAAKVEQVKVEAVKAEQQTRSAPAPAVGMANVVR